MGVFVVPISIAVFILCSAFCDGVNADINPSCPAIGQENKNSLALLYPVPGDCSSFYVCAHGKLIKLRCGKGTVFNPILKVCDWPGNVQCGNNTTAAPTTTSAPTTEVPTTVGPTTAGPTTVSPTTSNATSAVPTTAGPTTAGPTTAVPTTAGPTTAVPTTDPASPVTPTANATVTDITPQESRTHAVLQEEDYDIEEA